MYEQRSGKNLFRLRAKAVMVAIPAWVVRMTEPVWEGDGMGCIVGNGNGGSASKATRQDQEEIGGVQGTQGKHHLQGSPNETLRRLFWSDHMLSIVAVQSQRENVPLEVFDAWPKCRDLGIATCYEN
jgi:hypothetical protein